jgi:hypothetical protein
VKLSLLRRLATWARRQVDCVICAIDGHKAHVARNVTRMSWGIVTAEERPVITVCERCGKLWVITRWIARQPSPADRIAKN